MGRGWSNMRSAELVGVAQTIACCGEIGGISCRGEIAQRRVRSSLVVIVDPVRNLGPGMIESEEQALVEKLVAHAPVETLAEAILHRLSWRNEMPDDRVVLRPGEHGVRGELGPIVRDDHAGLAAPFDQTPSVPAPRAGLRSRCQGSPP